MHVILQRDVGQLQPEDWRWNKECRYRFKYLLPAQIKFALNSADTTEIRPAGGGNGGRLHWVIALYFCLEFQPPLTYLKALVIVHRSGKVSTRALTCRGRRT
jgi:hypothetical protein